MAQQTAVEQLIKMIDFEISMLEMDAGNCVEWSMSVMFGTLKKIKTEAEQAKQIEWEQRIAAQMDMFHHMDNADYGLDYLQKRDEAEKYAEQYYNETYCNNQNK